MSEQYLIIEPSNELSFVGPFTQTVDSVMKLTNPSDRKVCYKIKTTAPKRYCVKPNSGVIDPRDFVDIAVSLQPFDYESPEKNRHKFMVQWMIAPDGAINQDTLWKETDSSHLMDAKLKCLFIMPEGAEKEDRTDNTFKTAQASSTTSTKVGDSDLKKSVDEINKLQVEISTLRQENIQLKEETLRQKRLASSHRVDPDSCSAAYSSTVVAAAAPDQNVLTTTYLYAALIILLMGIIIGKWVI